LLLPGMPLSSAGKRSTIKPEKHLSGCCSSTHLFARRGCPMLRWVGRNQRGLVEEQWQLFHVSAVEPAAGLSTLSCRGVRWLQP
jgi:hypothetical protein